MKAMQAKMLLLLQVVLPLSALVTTFDIALRLRASPEDVDVGTGLLRSALAFVLLPPVLWVLSSLSWQFVYRVAYAPYELGVLILTLAPLPFVVGFLFRVLQIRKQRKAAALALVLWGAALAVWVMPLV